MTLTWAKESFRIPVSGTPLSVRVDDGGDLPRAVQHERLWDMLVWQRVHEPDLAGRADALLTLFEPCEKAGASPAACAGLSALLRERANEDSARYHSG